MPTPNPDDSLLLIRCPSCGQRFKVGEDLRERTVECGGCEHRFRIEGDVIVRGRKIYPGERASAGLHRFQRVPLPSGESMAGIQPIRYADTPDPAVMEPMSPQRILAGIVGVAGMILMGLLLMFGAQRGGVLDGMVLQNRLLMAAFASLLGLVLLVYANPKARRKALAFGLLLSAGLFAIPFGFKTASIPLDERTAEMAEADTLGEEGIGPAPAKDQKTEALRIRIGTGPLEAEIARMEETGSSKRAAGLWLREMSERNRFLVMDYILRVTGADPSTHYYPRDRGEFLMVVTGITATMQELAKSVSAFGEVVDMYPEISVIEVKVDNSVFLEGPIDKLGDKTDPAFYELNKRELESIDLNRVKRAVQRLAEAEPKIYRVDITRKLIELMGDGAVDFKGAVCTALEVWSEDPGPAGNAALAAARKMVAEGEAVPKEMITLIVKEGNPEVVPILDELWAENPSEWELLYSQSGPAAEGPVLQRFDSTNGMMRHSAVRVLTRVGGSASLPVLERALNGADSELKVLIEKARTAIRARMGQ